MDPDYLIVLYSKYSSQCKLILDVYNRASVDYIKLLCIDNVDVRTSVLKSQKLNLTTVPCVLLMYRDGSMEKFETGDVASWIKTQLEKYLPQPKVSQIEMQPQPQQVQPQPQMQQQQHMQPQQIQPQQMQPQQIQPQQMQPQPQMQTSVDSLSMSDKEDDSSSKKNVSVSDIAARMAAEREKSNPPPQQMLQS